MPSDPEVLNLLKTAHPFRLLKPEPLELLAEEVEVLLYKDGETIYQFGEDARKFYLILSGKVRLTRYIHEQDELYGLYERADVFGYEALVASQRFNMDATAVGDVRLIGFDENLLEALFKDEPQTALSLQHMYDSYFFSQRIPVHWMDEDEGIYFATLHHRLFTLMRLLPPLLLGLIITGILTTLAISGQSSMFGGFAIISFIIFALWFIWVWVDETNDYSIITNKRVVSIQKVVLLYESRQEIPLQAVLSNTMDTTYWGRILGYGDVRIRTYTGSMLFRRLAATKEVMSMLEEHRLRATQQRTRQERQAMIRFMQQRLKLLPPDQAKNQSGGIPTEIRQGALSALLNRMFQMRIVKEDAIIYRTHWFVLFKKTFIPGLLATGAFLGLVLSLFSWLPLSIGPLTSVIFFVLWLGFVGWWVYQYIDWSNDKYIITNTQIMDVNKKPLGNEEKRTAGLESIQEIEYQRLGLLGLLLNYGTVTILVGTEKLTFDEVYNPSEVQHELFERMNAKKQKDKMDKELREREQIADMLEIYHSITKLDP
ncbi:MAG TPA: cyclic nucleotide-binding domain-containing protein [Anaerolineaceae bacterium]|nr:cyclic nucleotide-binding domain-containing protein [Anaerolineaceae bacterium]